MSAASSTHLVLYDGRCGLCDRSVQFILARDRAATFVFAPLQSATATRVLAAHGIDAAVLDSVWVIADWKLPTERPLDQSRAALFIARRLAFPWPLATVFAIVPRGLRDWLYRRVAKNRMRFFGRLESCRVPTPELRARFVDP